MDDDVVDDPALEWKLCAAAIPAMLLLAVLFNVAGVGHFLQRTFLTMPVHEFGHAIAAWWAARRQVIVGVICFLALIAVYAWGVWRAWRVWREAESSPRK